MPLVLCCRTMSAGTVLMDWGGHRNIITCFFFVIVFHGKVCTTPTCYYNTGDAETDVAQICYLRSGYISGAEPVLGAES